MPPVKVGKGGADFVLGAPPKRARAVGPPFEIEPKHCPRRDGGRAVAVGNRRVFLGQPIKQRLAHGGGHRSAARERGLSEHPQPRVDILDITSEQHARLLRERVRDRGLVALVLAPRLHREHQARVDRRQEKQAEEEAAA